MRITGAHGFYWLDRVIIQLRYFFLVPVSIRIQYFNLRKTLKYIWILSLKIICFFAICILMYLVLFSFNFIHKQFRSYTMDSLDIPEISKTNPIAEN